MCAVRVGIIGTGFGAAVQAPGFRCVDGAELVAVASSRIQRAQAVAQEFRLPHAFDDYRAMLRSVPLDLVSITAPPYLHREMTLAALEAGAHVLCEKPMAMNADEANEMLRKAERSGLVHAIDFEFRYIPARAALTRLLAAGAIGEPILVRVADLVHARVDQPYGWFFDRARGGGLLQAIGSHYIDAVRLWLGPIASVTADLRAVRAERPRDDGGGHERVTADDTASVSLRLERGIFGRIDLSVCAPGGYRRTEIFGSQGVLTLEGTKLYRGADSGSEEVAPEAEDQGRLEDPRLGPFVELAQRVVDRINGRDGRPFPTFSDGLAVQRVMDAIHRASDEGREVRISEVTA
ncbi:MAG TPA: Gfo/Idh/MocA family oxidoreductase [Chloroflexota bacterium]|nr:Gfo/Idh/MocA family oxidoreductase [Chloroflexota bacterium]